MSRPDGQLSQEFRQFGTFEQMPPDVSPDHRYLVLPSGQVLGLSPTGLRVSGLSIASVMGPDSYIQPVAPFADKDRYLVVRQSNGYPGRQPAEPVHLQPLGAEAPVDLGSAADAAGDPAAPGAFVTVAVTTPVASSQPIISPPDSMVERRDAGEAPVPLGTAAQLLSDVGAPSSQLSLFDVYPSPDGSQVAVTVTADSSTPSEGSLVVLDRDGHVIGDVPAGLGPSGFSEPVWSPDGRTLAYVTYGTRGPELSMWNVGGSTTTVSLNRASGNEPVCLWAADGGGVLYSSRAGGAPRADQFRADWTVVLRSGATVSAAGGGYPLAWLPPT